MTASGVWPDERESGLACRPRGSGITLSGFGVIPLLALQVLLDRAVRPGVQARPPRRTWPLRYGCLRLNRRLLVPPPSRTPHHHKVGPAGDRRAALDRRAHRGRSDGAAGPRGQGRQGMGGARARRRRGDDGGARAAPLGADVLRHGRRADGRQIGVPVAEPGSSSGTGWPSPHTSCGTGTPQRPTSSPRICAWSRRCWGTPRRRRPPATRLTTSPGSPTWSSRWTRRGAGRQRRRRRKSPTRCQRAPPDGRQ